MVLVMPRHMPKVISCSFSARGVERRWPAAGGRDHRPYCEAIERTYPLLLPLLRFVHGGICFGRGCSNKRPDEKVNIEEFLIACQDLATRSSSSLYPFVASWHERLTEVGRLPDESGDPNVTNAFEFVARHCKKRLREWLTLNDITMAKYFRNLKDFITSGFRLHVFSLNYDECVELALEHELGEINGKWTTGFAHKGWKPDLLENKRKRFDALLYKLHGSLDWVEDEELGVCSLKWPMAERAEEIPDTYDSLLIFATAMKVIPRDPYLTLLVRFRTELFGASASSSSVTALATSTSTRCCWMPCGSGPPCSASSPTVKQTWPSTCQEPSVRKLPEIDFTTFSRRKTA